MGPSLYQERQRGHLHGEGRQRDHLPLEERGIGLTLRHTFCDLYPGASFSA